MVNGPARKTRMRLGGAVAVAVCALAGSPVAAHASPFASFSSSAVDQYQSNSGNGSAGNGGANGNGAANGNGGANSHKGKSSSHHHSSGVAGQGASGNGNRSSVSGSNVGVAPSTHPIKTKGTLPFTGLDLTMLVLVALGLLGAGLSLRATERLRSRRRANASS